MSRSERADEIAPAEAVRRRARRRAATRIVRSSEPGSVAEPTPRADVVDQAVPASGDVLRVLAGGGQAERGPAGVQLRRGRAGRRRRSRRRRSGRPAGSRPAWSPRAPRPTLEPGWPASQLQGQASRARPAPRAWRPGARDRQVTCSRVANRSSEWIMRRPEREREHQAAGRMDEVEPDPLAHVHPELGQAVIAVGHPVPDVLERGEREPDHRADDRQRPAPDPPAR